MSWSDRTWADSYGGARGGFGDSSLRPLGVFWLLGLIGGAHVLKVLVDVVSPGSAIWIETTFGYSTRSMLKGFLWTPLSYQFVHGGIGHLIGNAFGIFVFGRIAEGLIGRRQFVAAFLSIGATAVVLSRFMPGATAGAMVIGASGSLYAILGILFIAVPKLTLHLILLGAVQLRWIVIVYVGIDVLMLLGDGRGRGALGETGSGVALWVHLLGASLGMLFAALWPTKVLPWWNARHSQKVQRIREKELRGKADLERELDRILGKISAQGMDQLTPKEREFLRRRAEESSGRR